jgi:hypothetical protein
MCRHTQKFVTTVTQQQIVKVVMMLVAAFVLTASPVAFAQRTTGSLRGQVLDPQGAVVGNAKVVVTNEETGVAQVAETSSAGTYNVASLIAGRYTVAVEAAGFKAFVKKGVNVLAAQENVADAQLLLGTSSETVEVNAGGVEVQTTSSTINNNYDSKSVVDLPNAGGALNGSPINLAVLAPNVVAQPGGVTGVGGSVGGMRPRDNNFIVDGVDDNNLGVTGPNSTVIPDAVAEFALQTNQFSADTGHSAGGQFNLITKTGTNSWHGSGEEYFQNRNLNSIDNLTKQAIDQGTIAANPAYDNNRFGGTIGGPLKKNKWFVFGAYEYTDLHGQGTPTALLGPTSSGLATLQGMAADGVVANVLSYYPVAPSNNEGTITVNGADVPIGDVVIISPIYQKEHDFQVNSDYSTTNHQLSARFLFNQELFSNPVNSTQSLFNQALNVKNRKLALGDAWTLGSHLINDLHLSYSYYHQNYQNPCTQCPPDVTIWELGPVTVGPGDNQFNTQHTYQIVDSISWVKGKHTFKFGGQYMHFIVPQYFLSRSAGDNWYFTTETFINDLPPDDTGRTLRGAGSGSFLGTQSAMYGFAQDDYKITPRLTLNLGVRYEYWTNPLGASTQSLNSISDVPGVISFRDPKTDKNNIAPRVGFAWDPTGTGKTSLRGGFGVSYDVKFQNFASITLPPQLQSELNENSACTLTPQPAWCATGTGFLASGGLPPAYIAPATQTDARAITTSYIDDTVMPKTFTWSLGVQHELYQNATVEVRYLGTRGLELPVQYRRNFESAFDAGIQPLPTFLSTSDIPGTFDASTPTDMAINGFNPNTYAQYGFQGIVTSDPPLGASIYHAGTVTFTQRARHGLTLDANYTYAHTIDNGTNEFFTSLLNPRRAEDTNQLGLDRANSDLDVRHKFALSLIWQVPKFREGNGFMKAILNGYQIGSVFLAQSGQPVTIQSGIDANGNGDSAGDRAVFNPNGRGLTGSDVIPVCASMAGSTSGAAPGTTYLAPVSVLSNPNPTNGCADNPSNAFGFDPAIGYTPVDGTARYLVAGPGVRSTVGRNSINTPGFGVLNLSIFKNTHFTESKFLQLRAEFFNVLNHPNYSLSNGNVFNAVGITTATSAPGYAQVANPDFLNPKLFSGGSRLVTLGVKFIF